MEFTEFPKIARLKRECMISEKIDGTNAQILIQPTPDGYGHLSIAERDGLSMFAGSRSRYITPTDDNFGFAAWVKQHADELWTLGEGHHYGEWWGAGIQRRYGLTEKRFSLFNAWRWNDENPNRPACCYVVPNLYTGPFSTDVASTQIERLRTLGSVAAPGFMKPEGICIYLAAARTYFKQTLERDDEPKSKSAA
jgi:RNA ligase